MYAEQKNQASIKARRKPGKPTFACMERRTGWSAAMPIYMLSCPNCGKDSETHPAGYGRIHCTGVGCGFSARVTTWPRVRDKVLKPMVVPFAALVTFFITAAAAGAMMYHYLSQ